MYLSCLHNSAVAGVGSRQLLSHRPNSPSITVCSFHVTEGSGGRKVDLKARMVENKGGVRLSERRRVRDLKIIMLIMHHRT